eukprot:Sspe_Gene.115578::Locus_103181_Transcript_1_1_Confidence_1.000_Length_352::g.115578::m.115578
MVWGGLVAGLGALVAAVATAPLATWVAFKIFGECFLGGLATVALAAGRGQLAVLMVFAFWGLECCGLMGAVYLPALFKDGPPDSKITGFPSLLLAVQRHGHQVVW